MPNTKLLQLAFNGGEVSPEMYGRVDIRDNQAGLRTCKNMYIKPQGAAKKRPGLEYVDAAASNSTKSRLIAFQSSPQTIIEVSANTFRFFRDAEAISTPAENYAGTRSCTVNIGNGIFTLTSGTLDGFPDNSRVNVFGTTAFAPGATYTNLNLGNVVRFSYGLTGTATWQYVNNLGQNYIQFPSGHGLRDNDAVAIRTLSPSTVIKFYYVSVINSTQMRLRVGAQGSAAMNFAQHTAAVSGTTPEMFRMLTASAINYTSAHHRIRVLSPTTFQLADSAEAANITAYFNAGTNSLTLQRGYDAGTLLYNAPVSGTAGRYQLSATSWSGSDVTSTWVNYAVNNATPSNWSLVAAGPNLFPYIITHNSGYTDQELAELTYAQLNNTITIAHRNKPTLTLTYTNDQTWAFAQASYAPSLAAPTGVSGTAYGPIKFRIERAFTGFMQPAGNDTSVVAGDSVKFGPLVSGGPTGFGGKFANNYFTVIKSDYDGTNQRQRLSFKVNSLTTITPELAGLAPGDPVDPGGGSGGTAVNITFELWPDDSSSTTEYVVTAVDDDGLESQPSTAITVTNNLYARETYNVLTWAQVPGARRYYVYKKQTGLFGYIGQTDSSAGVSFRDDNITPDLSKAPPILDTTLSETGAYPGAVAYFEQRKVLAGTTAKPAKIWMTRSNTEQDLSYSLPIKDTDRIAFQVASKDINVIRHIVSSQELLALTDQAEWRITSINSDALTPSTVSVRPQSFVGASYVSPVIVNNAVVYEASRGGHVRQLGFNFNAQGYTTTDLSLKAAHLFDDYTLADMAQMRSPLPILWMPSSNGKLLALTYIPEEQVACWHQHETDGVVESVACIQEGTVDSLYAVVRRTINGQTKRYIERMTDVRSTGSSSNYLDSSLYGDFTHTGTNTLRLAEYQGQGWAAGATIQISEATAASIFSSSDTDDQLELTASDGTKHRVQILSLVSASSVLCRVLTPLPSILWNAVVASWAFARDQFGGLSHLVAKTVGVVADGEYIGDFTVSATGTVSLPVYAVTARIGLKYTSELKTLPAAMQIEAAGQGRTKNVNKVWVRVENQEEFLIGPDANNLVPSGTLSVEETNEELQVTLLPSWSQDGSIVVRQPDPVPLTVNGLAIEVAIGS
jgi:hypothetical protein